ALHETIQSQRFPETPNTSPEPMDTAASSEAAPAPFAQDSISHLETDLPTQTTPFFGRSSELAEITWRLQDPDCRLLTIIGPGGIGKTRLAIEAAQQITTIAASDYLDGAHFVALAPVRSTDLFASSLLETFACYIGAEANFWEVLLTFLRDRHLLLVLDNFEHLLPAADLLPELLAAAPGVKLLITARERLNLREEWLLELRGLDYPIDAVETGLSGKSLIALEAYSAVQLFLQGARRMRPNFRLNSDDIPAVMRICRLVDGMPLGLELAAAWLPLLSVSEIAREIQHSLDFLSTTTRNIPERHRSLRAVFEHSWSTLSDEEQACLRRLSVFHNAFDLEAAQRVSWANLHLLLALTDKSLIRRTPDGCYEIHELLRQFAESKLSRDEYVEIRHEHARYYSDFLASALPDLLNENQSHTLNEIQSTLDDIRAAWYHAVEFRQWQMIMQMLEPLAHYTMARYRLHDFREMLAKAIQSLGDNPAISEDRLLLGCLLSTQASTAGSVSNHQVIEEIMQRSQRLLAEFPDHPTTAFARMTLGSIRVHPGRSDSNQEALIRSGLALAEATNNRWGMGYGYGLMGWLMQNRVRYGDARQYFSRALEIFRQIGQPLGQVKALNGLADNYRTLGEHERANQAL
ncbi:MAG TPA: hypothetical protein VHL11_24530, partial [Phototrophicaceae bacterium]|nr:hypothetical protein [Phototrophicaceae bacterium]